MRAILCNGFHGIRALSIGAAPEPRPGSDEVLIDVHAVCVSFADYLMICGGYQKRPTLPYVPGMDAAGVVVACGENVQLSAKARRMTINGRMRPARNLRAPLQPNGRLSATVATVCPFHSDVTVCIGNHAAESMLLSAPRGSSRAVARIGKWSLDDNSANLQLATIKSAAALHPIGSAAGGKSFRAVVGVFETEQRS
ncbi:alcohol dehydrogenase catalytic domain-containing protein [Bradyrhizobium liaoningense]|uniref:alcohol dehydrogenase catalytic domain-containing protein n=1 Tax=Bradyrhizobium liaoningense TaxID=43992 RepID=UPI001BA47FEC|nr:alcohol dehydrogenase catalytic domain-containing protein [Bradyrhizobium liaoningense]MBR0719111.1 alcohol dehydrogenase catalytic domain-containing protein [Bradyrhizobium liaoningense]